NSNKHELWRHRPSVTVRLAFSAPGLTSFNGPELGDGSFLPGVRHRRCEHRAVHPSSQFYSPVSGNLIFLLYGYSSSKKPVRNVQVFRVSHSTGATTTTCGPCGEINREREGSGYRDTGAYYRIASVIRPPLNLL
ncbi:hypothetical protein LSAT2_014736, partial [Lamellibrachia satsuma]